MLFTTTILKQSQLKKWNLISSEWKFLSWKITYKWGESVLQLSVTKKFCISLMSVQAHDFAVEIWDEQGDQMGISAKLVRESEIIPDPYSLKSDWTLPTSFGLTACSFFLEVNTFLFFDICVVFPWLPCAAFTHRLFGGLRWRCCGNASIEGTGFNLVRPGPPSKWTEHIPVCLITFKLSRRRLQSIA